jgi:hypothetical protein
MVRSSRYQTPPFTTAVGLGRIQQYVLRDHPARATKCCNTANVLVRRRALIPHQSCSLRVKPKGERKTVSVSVSLEKFHRNCGFYNTRL